MCGLIAAFAKGKAKMTGQVAYELYKKQAQRGRNGYGVVAIRDKRIVAVNRYLDEDSMRKDTLGIKADIVLLHHRLPTSTTNTIGTTHPIFVRHDELEYDYLLAHNGVISNASKLKVDHEKLGYLYTTEHTEITAYKYKHNKLTEYAKNPGVTKFNDSESLAIEFARYLDGKQDKINTLGGAAFWAVVIEKGTDKVVRVVFGRNGGRELGIKQQKKFLVLASETGKDIGENVMVDIDIDTLKRTDYTLDIETYVLPSKTNATTSNYSPGFNMGYRTIPDDPVNLLTAEERTLYFALPNAQFTYEEMKATGVSQAMFIRVHHANDHYFVPKRFEGNFNGRMKFSDYLKKYPERVSTLILPAPKEEKPTHDKAKIARLEQLVIDHEHWNKRLDALQSRKEATETSAFNVQYQLFVDKIQEIEDEIEGLELPDSLVDEYIDIAGYLYGS